MADDQEQILYEEVELKKRVCFPMGKDGTWWRVLNVDWDANEALVIARESICKKAYHDRMESVTWENCTLRQWLNGEYYDKTFNAEEKEAILETNLENPDNAQYNTRGGNRTKDKIFILSIDEAEKYFVRDADRGNGSWWWLRSPGDSQASAVNAYNDGSVNYRGRTVINDNGCVRPTMKINLKSELFQSLLSINPNGEAVIRIPQLYIRDSRLLSMNPAYKTITAFIIPEGVTVIGEAVFRDCKNLKEVKLPESLKKIGKDALYGCGTLTSIRVPDGLTEIGQSAFQGCHSLTSIEIPESVTEIGQSAFQYCSSLRSINIPDSVTSIDERVFSGCSSLTSITIPKSVTEIGQSAFQNCSSLRSINIPDSVTSIDERVFSGCSSLTSIHIPDNVTSIGTYPFSGCDSINRLHAPFSLLADSRERLLGALTFMEEMDLYSSEEQKKYLKYISSQKKKIIPEILKKDDVKALHVFSDAGKITKQNIDDDFLNPAILEKATQCIAFLMSWKEKNISPEYLEKKFFCELNKDPFNVSDMKKLWSYDVLEEGVMITGYKGKGRMIEIPERIGDKPVFGIDTEAFSTEKSGRYTAVKETLIKITSLYIPENIKFIGDCAFAGCESIRQVEVAPGNKAYRCQNNCLIDVQHKKIIAGFMNAVIPDDGSVKYIGDYAFCRSSLNDMVIPDKISAIGVYAFSECKNIANITIPGTIKSIQQKAFSDISSLVNVILCSGVKTIEKMAFSYCPNLRNVTIPSTVIRIHDYAFYESTYNLTIHTMEDSVLTNSIIARYANLEITPKEAASDDGINSTKTGFRFSNVSSIDFSGKIYVLTGFDEADEGKMTERIVLNGGIVKSSVVMATDYLVVNEQYDHQTTKYKRAMELNEKGKNIKIISKAIFDKL